MSVYLTAGGRVLTQAGSVATDQGCCCGGCTDCGCNPILITIRAVGTITDSGCTVLSIDHTISYAMTIPTGDCFLFDSIHCEDTDSGADTTCYPGGTYGAMTWSIDVFCGSGNVQFQGPIELGSTDAGAVCSAGSSYDVSVNINHTGFGTFSDHYDDTIGTIVRSIDTTTTVSCL